MDKLLWITDMHLESCSDQTINGFFYSIDPGSTIIITGDISNSRRLIPDLRAIANALKSCEIYFVLGNHDFYGNTINNIRSIIDSFVYMQGNLHYLPSINKITYLLLGAELWALVGVDGWADAKEGNFDAAPSLLRDYQEINDFSNMDSVSKRRFLNLLGKEEAYKLKEKLSQDISCDNILIATHVPPYKEAHVYNGKPASSIYLPHFVCASTGEVISEYALAHKDKQIHIICGHTHQKYDVKIMDNVTVHVGYANYSELLCVDLDKVLDGKN